MTNISYVPDENARPVAAAHRPSPGSPTFRNLVLGGCGAAMVAFIAACAPTATAPSAPTAVSAATAAASPVATLVAASPVTTVAAAASAAASPAAAIVAASPVRITAAQLSPTDTTITVQNAGNAVVDMTGWQLRVGGAAVTLPSNSRVAPGESITIHTASGTNSGTDVYLGSDAATLASGLQPGATVALVDAQGTVVSEFVLPR